MWSRLQPDRTGRGGERPNFMRACGPQHTGAGLERRASCPHIVDENDDTTADVGLQTSARHQWGQPERAADVSSPAGRRQSCLRHRGTATPQRLHHAKVQSACQIARLVEPTPCVPQWVKGDRHKAVGVGEHGGTRVPHQASQRLRERSSSFVLQALNDASQSAAVITRRTRADEQGRGAAAARTACERKADRAPRWELIAARDAQRWQQWSNGRPAGGADRTVQRCVERFRAGRASRSQNSAKQRIERSSCCCLPREARHHRLRIASVWPAASGVRLPESGRCGAEPPRSTRKPLRTPRGPACRRS
jgi:hypothetical protein